MRERMRADLTTAMKARDLASVKVPRSALAAIENAEARPAEAPAPTGGRIAGVTVGVGSTERDRRLLGEADVRAVVEREIEHSRAAAQYEELGRPDLADG